MPFVLDVVSSITIIVFMSSLCEYAAALTDISANKNSITFLIK